MFRFLSIGLAAAALATAALTSPAQCASMRGDAKLAAIGEIYYSHSWHFRPAEATSVGVHEYLFPLGDTATSAHAEELFDFKLGSVAPADFAAEIARLHSTLDAVRAIKTGDLSLDGKADRQLLVSDIGRRLFNLEERPEWRISPS